MAAAVINPRNRIRYAARRERRAEKPIVHQDDETRCRLPCPTCDSDSEKNREDLKDLEEMLL
jgi:hypothetical protein